MAALDLTSIYIRTIPNQNAWRKPLNWIVLTRQSAKKARAKFNLPHPWAASEKQFWFTSTVAAPRGDEVLPGTGPGERYKRTSSFYLWRLSFFLLCLLYQTAQGNLDWHGNTTWFSRAQEGAGFQTFKCLKSGLRFQQASWNIMKKSILGFIWLWFYIIFSICARTV